MNTIEVFAPNPDSKFILTKMEETEQELKFTSTTVVRCKSLSAKFSQHVSPLLYNTFAVIETGSDV